MSENKNNIENEEEVKDTSEITETEVSEKNEEKHAHTPKPPKKKSDSDKPKTKTVEKTDEKKWSRKAQHRLVSVVLICLVLIAAVLLNVISAVLTDRFSGLTADITSSGAYNLSDTTMKLVSGVKKKVTITFLADKASYEAVDTYYKQAVSLAEKMKQNSDGFITVEYVDLIKNPTYSSKYENEELTVTDVIVKCGDKYNILKKEDLFNYALDQSTGYQYITSSKVESAIDTAIVKVTSEVSNKIAIVNDNTEDDYSYISKLLTANNYEVVEMSIEKEDIPDGVNTVIAYAPEKDYTEKAVEKLRKFLNNDGNYDKSIFYIAYMGQTETPNIDELLKSYGMTVSDGLAFDADTTRQYSSGDMYRFIATKFASQEFTENITENDTSVLSSRSKAVASLNDNITEPLLTYSSQSGVYLFDDTEETFDIEKAMIGNINVMMLGLSGNDQATSKLIFSGSTDMWTQTIMQSDMMNQTYFLNIINDLNHREDNSIRLEDKIVTEYNLHISSSTAITVGVIMFAVIPVLIIGAGIMVYIVRRRR